MEYYSRHHQRLKAYLEKLPVKLLCQDCGGAGGWVEAVLDDGSGPFYQCGFCEGFGLVTPHMRGLWLKFKREDKRDVEEEILKRMKQNLIRK